jgi:hypothetical protein
MTKANSDELTAAAASAREAIESLKRSCETALRAIDAGKYRRVGPGEFQQAINAIAAAAVLQERLRTVR